MDEAERLYRRSLAIYEKALGQDHPDVAASLNNIAALLEKKVRHVISVNATENSRRKNDKETASGVICAIVGGVVILTDAKSGSLSKQIATRQGMWCVDTK